MRIGDKSCEEAWIFEGWTYANGNKKMLFCHTNDKDSIRDYRVCGGEANTHLVALWDCQMEAGEDSDFVIR